MIKVKNVSKHFANETAIDYSDITFEKGKSYMLLGASGCGKSTLLNMIAGIISPTEGEVIIDGVTMSSASQKEKDKFRIQKIGYIFQDFKLIPEMTVMEFLNFVHNEKRYRAHEFFRLRDVYVISLGRLYGIGSYLIVCAFPIYRLGRKYPVSVCVEPLRLYKGLEL